MRLVDYLKVNKLNRSQFAKIVGISPIHMSNICNGKKSPSLALTRRIIEVTKGQVTVADLLHPDAPRRFKDKENDN